MTSRPALARSVVAPELAPDLTADEVAALTGLVDESNAILSRPAQATVDALAGIASENDA